MAAPTAGARITGPGRASPVALPAGRCLEGFGDPGGHRVLELDCLHDFATVSDSADRYPDGAGFHRHRGYEMDSPMAPEESRR